MFFWEPHYEMEWTTLIKTFQFGKSVSFFILPLEKSSIVHGMLTPGNDTTSRLDMIIIPFAASNNPSTSINRQQILAESSASLQLEDGDPLTQHNGQVYWEDRRKVSRPPNMCPTTGPFEISRTICPALALTQLFCRALLSGFSAHLYRYCVRSAS